MNVTRETTEQELRAAYEAEMQVLEGEKQDAYNKMLAAEQEFQKARARYHVSTGVILSRKGKFEEDVKFLRRLKSSGA